MRPLLLRSEGWLLRPDTSLTRPPGFSAVTGGKVLVSAKEAAAKQTLPCREPQWSSHGQGSNSACWVRVESLLYPKTLFWPFSRHSIFSCEMGMIL